MRRRTLLAAGAAAVVAGCGKDQQLGPPPAAEALLRQLAAERALGASLAGLGFRRLADRSNQRAEILAAELSAAGGRPHDAARPQPDGNRGRALARGRAVLEAHVAALPSLTRRDLGADLLTRAAADVAVMHERLRAPVDDPFPGTPR